MLACKPKMKKAEAELIVANQAVRDAELSHRRAVSGDARGLLGSAGWQGTCTRGHTTSPALSTVDTAKLFSK